jgi:hypothetical protein
MSEEEIIKRLKDMYTDNKSKLLDFKSGSYATILLQSGQEIMISIGTASVKFMKPGFLSYVTPKTIINKDISDWDKRYRNSTPLEREGTKMFLLIGLLLALSKIKSESEIEAAINFGNALGAGYGFSVTGLS